MSGELYKQEILGDGRVIFVPVSEKESAADRNVSQDIKEQLVRAVELLEQLYARAEKSEEAIGELRQELYELRTETYELRMELGGAAVEAVRRGTDVPELDEIVKDDTPEIPAAVATDLTESTPEVATNQTTLDEVIKAVSSGETTTSLETSTQNEPKEYQLPSEEIEGKAHRCAELIVLYMLEQPEFVIVARQGQRTPASTVKQAIGMENCADWGNAMTFLKNKGVISFIGKNSNTYRLNELSFKVNTGLPIVTQRVIEKFNSVVDEDLQLDPADFLHTPKKKTVKTKSMPEKEREEHYSSGEREVIIAIGSAKNQTIISKGLAGQLASGNGSRRPALAQAVESLVNKRVISREALHGKNKSFTLHGNRGLKIFQELAIEQETQRGADFLA